MHIPLSHMNFGLIMNLISKTYYSVKRENMHFLYLRSIL